MNAMLFGRSRLFLAALAAAVLAGGLAPLASAAPPVAQKQTAFTPRGVLSGRITDPDGKPIAGARVILSRGGGMHVTDAAGIYSVDRITRDDYHSLTIHAEGFVSISGASSLETRVELNVNSRKVRHFTLQPGIKIGINVVDEAGDPLARVRIEYAPLGPAGFNLEQITNSSSASGPVMTAHIPLSTTPYAIYATRADLAMTLTTFIPAELEGERELTITMAKGEDLRGVAICQDGLPAEGWEVSAVPSGWMSRRIPPGFPIQADGSFTIPNVGAGRHLIRLHIPEPGRSWPFGPPVATVTLPLAEDLLRLDLPYDSPARQAGIAGSVTTEGGRTRGPMIRVRAISAEGEEGRSFVEIVGGEFEIGHLPRGLYELRFTSSVYREKVLHNVPAPIEGLKVDLEYIGEARLTGTVVDAATGLPVTDYRARPLHLRPLAGGSWPPESDWIHVEDPEGRFDLTARWESVWKIQIAAPGHPYTWSDELPVTASVLPPEPVHFELAQGAAIEGRVTDAAGEPVAGARIIPFSKTERELSPGSAAFDAPMGTAESGADGAFRLEHAAVGFESIKIAHPDFAYALIENIETREGETIRGMEIALSKGGAIRGRVFDVDGQPLRHAALRALDRVQYPIPMEVEGALPVLTDDEGYFQVDRLPEGAVYFSRRLTGQEFGVLARVIVPREGETLRLDFGGGPQLTGTLVEGGQPVVQRALILSAGYAVSGVFDARAQTDANGRFTFHGAPPGRLTLYYERQNPRLQYVQLRDVTVDDEDQDMGEVSLDLARVSVRVRGDASPAADRENQLIHLTRYGADLFGGRAIASAPPDPDSNAPTILEDVPPGEYWLTAASSDPLLRLRRRVVITPGQSDYEIELTAPRGTASVSGRAPAEGPAPFILSNPDRTRLYFIERDGDEYRVENLPAGEYKFALFLGLSTGPIADTGVRFTLGEGESRTIDLHEVEALRPPESQARATFVGAEGEILVGVEAWIERGGFRYPAGNITHHSLFMAPRGDYTLHARLEGYEPIETGIAVAPFDYYDRERLPYPPMQYVRLTPIGKR